jgi:hypothetical protein
MGSYKLKEVKTGFFEQGQFERKDIISVLKSGASPSDVQPSLLKSVR